MLVVSPGSKRPTIPSCWSEKKEVLAGYLEVLCDEERKQERVAGNRAGSVRLSGLQGKGSSPHRSEKYSKYRVHFQATKLPACMDLGRGSLPICQIAACQRCPGCFLSKEYGQSILHLWSKNTSETYSPECGLLFVWDADHVLAVEVYNSAGRRVSRREQRRCCKYGADWRTAYG